jgi:very-short-patch-repair endonuclease
MGARRTSGPAIRPVPRRFADESLALAREAGVLAVEAIGEEQDGIVNREQVYQLGLDRHDIAREVRRGRWRLVGRFAIAMHRGPLDDRAMWRRAVAEIGPDAALDGVTSLIRWGLTGYIDSIHASVPHGSQPNRVSDVTVHEVCDWRDGDVIDGDIPAVRPALATLRAATWARTPRQTALLIVLPVQQRLVRTDELVDLMSRWRRMRRRGLIKSVIADAADGALSMGELDFARECRRRHLPRPSRQVVRQGPNGRWYLDVYFDEFDVVVEIEGIHHTEPLNAIDDTIRQNDITIGVGGVLRITVLGWRLHREQYMDQVERMLGARGWTH